jgi:DNA-binding winged helix-turn-helix (wHTH) protein
VFYRFGEYTLAPERYELKRGEEVVPVEPQVLLVLAVLIANRDRVVLKDELLERVWGDVFVGESTVSSRIMAARRAIGDSGAEQVWIKTVHGRGFRFVGHVAELDESIDNAVDLARVLQRAETSLKANRIDEAEAYLTDAFRTLESMRFEPDTEYADWHRLKAQVLLLKEGWSSESARTHYLESIRLAEGVGAVEIFRSARYDLATMLEVRGDFRASATLMSAALADPDLADVDAEARELLACSLFHQGKFSECAAQAQGGLVSAGRPAERRLCAFYGEDAEVSCLHWLAICTWLLGHDDEALRLSQRAVRISERPGMIFCLAHSRQQSALFHQLRGDAAQAAHWAQSLVWIGSRQNLPYRTAYGEIILNWSNIQDQPTYESVERMEAAVASIAQVGANMELPYLRTLLAEALLAVDESKRAVHLLEEVIEDTICRPGYFYLSEMCRIRALAGVRTHESEDQIQHWVSRAEEVALAQGATALLSRVRQWDATRHQPGRT